MPARPRLPRLPKFQLPGDARDNSNHRDVLSELRCAILEGRIPPGTELSIAVLAERFGISETPVEEAVHALIDERLVEQSSDFGFAVTQLTPSELREMYVVRETLESAALAAAVTLAGPDDHVYATEAHKRLEHAVRIDDPVAYHQESKNFHLALTRPSRMDRLVHMLEAAWNVTEPIQSMLQVSTDERAELHADHRRQLEAFLARDVAELLMVSEQHHAKLITVISSLPMATGLLEPEEI